MSRNKTILLLLLYFVIYLVLPNTPKGLLAKSIMLQAAACVLVFMLIYGIIMLNMLKRAMRRLADEVTDENVTSVSKLLRITFDVKRMFGTETLRSLYNQVNASQRVSLESKQRLYEAIRRKRIEIAVPAKATGGNATVKKKLNKKKK